MIKVDRPPPPPILQKKADDWRRELFGAKTNKAREKARNRYRHPQVKAALIELFHGKCAYCESKITHVDYGHIDHFRPKSGPAGRPDLTFAWSNLFLACGRCNGAGFKSDRFPEADEGGPLVNPCDDEPNEHLEFRFDTVAMLANVYGRTRRGCVTEEVLGLNRPELRVYRSQFIEKLFALSIFAKTDAMARELLRRAVRSDSEYAAFARALFRDDS
jgi:uncharacterized protein (TIGR02646 family)